MKTTELSMFDRVSRRTASGVMTVENPTTSTNKENSDPRPAAGGSASVGTGSRQSTSVTHKDHIQRSQPTLRWVRPEDIVGDVLDRLCTTDLEADEELARCMRRYGFDPARSLIVWSTGGMRLLVDGHRRLEAAKAAGLTEVPVVFRQFEDDREMMVFVLTSHLSCRRLGDTERTRLLSDVRRLQAEAGDQQRPANYECGEVAHTVEPCVPPGQAESPRTLDALRAALVDVQRAESRLQATKPERAELYPVRTSVRALQMGIRDLEEFGRPMPPDSYAKRKFTAEEAG